MSLAEYVLLAVAGIVSGAVNAAAGGGSLLTFPALLATGLPALDANVTNTVATWPGYVGSAYAYRAELRGQRARLAMVLTSASTGAVAGSVLLLVVDESVFDTVVPGLILGACALLGFRPQITARVARRRGDTGRREGSVALHLGVFGAGVYGAYFGGGLGVVLLAVLGTLLVDELHRINAARIVTSAVVNAIALGIFVAAAPVSWSAVVVLAPTSTAGGYLGARITRRLDPDRLRLVIVTFGVAVATAMVLT